MCAVRALQRNAALITIFVIALGLRAWHFAEYPRHNQTADEYAWTWSGMELLGPHHVPRAWSWLPPYSDTQMLSWRGSEYRMVRPWLDHPPLYSIYEGAWMRMLGYRDIKWVDLRAMRAANLPLFTIAFWLLAAVLSRLCDRRMMLVTMAVFALCPLAVFNQRLVVAENLFIPIHLAMLLLLLREERRWTLPLLAIGAIALPLSKVAAVAMSAHLLIVAWMRQRRRAALVIAAGTVVGALAFWLWGRHFDAALFSAVVHAQKVRFLGFHAFHEILFDPKVVDDHVPYHLFFLALAVLIGDARAEGSLEWLLLVLVYAGLISFFADGSMVRGWYALPLMAPLAFGLARQIMNMWEEPGARSKWLWIAFAAPDVAHRLLESHADRIDWLRYSYLGLLATAVAMFLWLPRAPRPLRQAATVALVGGQLLSDVVLILSR